MEKKLLPSASFSFSLEIAWSSCNPPTSALLFLKDSHLAFLQLELRGRLTPSLPGLSPGSLSQPGAAHPRSPHPTPGRGHRAGLDKGPGMCLSCRRISSWPPQGSPVHPPAWGLLGFQSLWCAESYKGLREMRTVQFLQLVGSALGFKPKAFVWTDLSRKSRPAMCCLPFLPPPTPRPCPCPCSLCPSHLAEHPFHSHPSNHPLCRELTPGPQPGFLDGNPSSASGDPCFLIVQALW